MDKVKRDLIIQNSKDAVWITLIPSLALCFWIPSVLLLPVVVFARHMDMKRFLNKL